MKDMKVGDKIKLKTLRQIKLQYSLKEILNSRNFNVGNLHINGFMLDMFGKSWRINNLLKNNNGRGYDFDIIGPEGIWAFSEKWIDKEIIMDVDDLFSEIDI